MKTNSPPVLYLLTSNEVNLFGQRKGKIGITGNLIRRKRELQLESQSPLQIAHVQRFPSIEKAYAVEKAFQNKLWRQKINGEWFWLHPMDIDMIKAVKNYNHLLIMQQSGLFDRLERIKDGKEEPFRIISFYGGDQAA